MDNALLPFCVHLMWDQLAVIGQAIFRIIEKLAGGGMGDS